MARAHRLQLAVTVVVTMVAAVMPLGGVGRLGVPAAVSAAASVYPLKVGANRRFITDQAGAPYLMAADTAWNIYSRLTTAEAIQYLDARKAQGFNTILTSIVDVSAGGMNGKNRAGQAPFGGNSLVSPNAGYFTQVDTVINLARDRGLGIVIVPAWLQLTSKAGAMDSTTAAAGYGAWIGARYKAYDNVMWMLGGDYGGNGTDTCPNQAAVRAMAAALKQADGRHLITYHPGPSQASTTCYAGDSWLDANSNYWDFNDLNVSSSYRFTDRDYAVAPTRPVIMMETGYEGPFLTDKNVYAATAYTSRVESYSMVLAGGYGFTYGQNNTYDMVNGGSNTPRTWQQTLLLPGGTYQGNINKLFSGLAWSKLVPDRNHQTLTAGYGTYGNQDYATSGRADDGSLAVAYLPTARTATVNLARLSGSVTARWYDPGSGAYKVIESGLAASGSRQFTTPGTNAAGQTDWVLVLTADAAAPATPAATPVPGTAKGDLNGDGVVNITDLSILLRNWTG